MPAPQKGGLPFPGCALDLVRWPSRRASQVAGRSKSWRNSAASRKADGNCFSAALQGAEPPSRTGGQQGQGLGTCPGQGVCAHASSERRHLGAGLPFPKATLLARNWECPGCSQRPGAQYKRAPPQAGGQQGGAFCALCPGLADGCPHWVSCCVPSWSLRGPRPWSPRPPVRLCWCLPRAPWEPCHLFKGPSPYTGPL